MNDDEPQTVAPDAEITAMINAAQNGLEQGRMVSVSAIGLRGWVVISSIMRARIHREKAELLHLVGRFGENENAHFYLPVSSLLAVRLADDPTQ